jgi:hypothetical protein
MILPVASLVGTLIQPAGTVKLAPVSDAKSPLDFSADRAEFQVLDYRMEVSEPVQCPFCGQAFEVVIDTSLASQHLTIDCEICCRPFEIVVECEPGEVLSLETR